MNIRKYRTLTLSLILSSTMISTNVYAQSVSNLQNKQKNIESDINNANKKIGEKKSSLEDVKAEIVKLDKELKVATDELYEINTKLENVKAELNQANEDLVKATQEKNDQQQALQDRVRYMYMYGDTSYLDTLLSSKSFSDLLNRVEYLKVIHEYDQNIYNSLAEKEAEIQGLIETIEKSKKEVEVLQKSATQKKDELQANVSQKEALNKKIESDIDVLESQLDELDKANKDIESMIQAEIRRQQEEAAKKGTVANTTYTGGKLMWPSDTTRTSSPFGYRIHPITGKRKLHAGVDVPVSIGSKVYSAESGTVITSGWVQGYGNTVIIMHDNGLTTLYGHLSSQKVSNGQRVNRGDLIALSGNSGNSTGPHLHFEVRLNGTAVDPMGYVQ